MPKLKNQIPNMLTTLRMLMVPIFFIFMIKEGRSFALVSLIIFCLASLTDYFDGMLARRWNIISDFGKVMDPLADKLLVLTALGGLTWQKPFSLNMAIFFIILAREIAVTILREVYQKRGTVIPADKLGKLKTVMQMAGIIIALAALAFFANVPFGLIYGVEIWFWIVALITLISGLNYFKLLFKKGASNA